MNDNAAMIDKMEISDEYSVKTTKKRKNETIFDGKVI